MEATPPRVVNRWLCRVAVDQRRRQRAEERLLPHDHSVAVLLRTDGKKVRKVGETNVGTLAEGIAFSPDGRFLYVGNWGEQELATFRLAGNRLLPVESPLKLPGHPASMRGSMP